MMSQQGMYLTTMVDVGFSEVSSVVALLLQITFLPWVNVTLQTPPTTSRSI